MGQQLEPRPFETMRRRILECRPIASLDIGATDDDLAGKLAWDNPAGVFPGKFQGKSIRKSRFRGRSSMVERQLPKLHTRVRFPSPAPDPGKSQHSLLWSCWYLIRPYEGRGVVLQRASRMKKEASGLRRYFLSRRRRKFSDGRAQSLRRGNQIGKEFLVNINATLISGKVAFVVRLQKNLQV